jgi:two-component system cell cycle response regulator CpdR
MARILIAEDEDAIRILIARALRQDGHDVVTAIDGAQALDALAREKGAFELLLTDIRMPVMDGIALAHAAARNHPDVTIVLMTGYADQRERAHGLDARIHDVIYQAVLARGDAPRGQRRALHSTAAEALAASAV